MTSAAAATTRMIATALLVRFASSRSNDYCLPDRAPSASAGVDLAAEILGNNGLAEKLMPKLMLPGGRMLLAALVMMSFLRGAGVAAAGQGNEPPNPLASVKA